ncbi:MAG: acyltransferase family protein [Planctomycetes bacterium]|nr:acyltransferase family protein [Planctomycetota bacterium]
MLRGLAAVLVVFVHAGIPYMTYPLPHLVWPSRDTHPSAIVDAITWCSDGFLMALFFAVAGFCSRGLLIARGDRQFLADRTQRVWWASWVAGLTILPVCLVIWCLGWMADGLYAPHSFLTDSLRPDLEAELYGVGHIWFLQNLYIYCLILYGVSWLSKWRSKWSLVTGRSDGSRPLSHQLSLRSMDLLAHVDRVLDHALLSVWKPFVPAIPCALLLYWDPRIVLGFYQGFIPVLSKLIFFGICFFVGVAMHRQRQQMLKHAQFGRTYLVFAVALFGAALPLIHEFTEGPLGMPILALLAFLLALFAWFATFGLIAVALRSNFGNHPLVRYLSEASYWIYLIHLPFVVLTQIAVAQLSIPALGKFLIAGMTGLFLALLTYDLFVRDTWIGEFLNGHRRPRPPRLMPQAVSVTRPAVALTNSGEWRTKVGSP